MRECRTSGSVRGVLSNGHPYRNPAENDGKGKGRDREQPGDGKFHGVLPEALIESATASSNFHKRCYVPGAAFTSSYSNSKMNGRTRCAGAGNSTAIL